MLELSGREIASGLLFPEGPVAMADGSVVLVEIARGTLSRVHPDGRVSVVADLGGGPNGAAIGPDGKFYVCNNGGFDFTRETDGLLRPHRRAERYIGGRIQRVDPESGRVEDLYTECDGVPLKGPNDIVLDGHGGFWFTDLGKVYDRLMDRGAVYYARTDGSLIREAVFPMITPNGIGLSPDGSTLYVAETESARLWAFRITGEGTVQKDPFPSPNGGRCLVGLPGYQRFDSLKVEAGGNVCVATLISGGVSVVSPDGEWLEFHRTSEPYCTNVAFGGSDLRRMYVTLSGFGRLIEVDWARPGLRLPGQALPAA
ncbi:MAG: SMP-30/gluconolactonase/LRE family protein [Betaproteobacteria bacterium]|nr:SMP-30/gluconolactonase/LRE family protein [Betaproteobacteria bacterium]